MIPGWMFLAMAIVTEVTATLALRASEGFSRLLPSVVVVLGYGAAFACLGLALREIPVSVSYAVWSGLGTVGASVGGVLLFGEHLSLVAIAGIALVIVGVAMILLSGSGG